jgi:hypothetical protein
MRQFWLIEPANEQRLCWNLNALLQKIGGGNRGEITISWMVKAVTAIARRPPQICGEVLQFCSDGPTRPPAHAAPLAITRSRHPQRLRGLRDRTAGRKIVLLP